MYPMMLFPLMMPNIRKLAISHSEPPTVYALLNSYVNFDKEESEKIKIKDLPSAGREMFFNFDYPLSSHLNKEDFESMILKHFLMRRIGFDTVTAFSIALDAKMNEIMPYYNKLFDALNGWNLLNDGYSLTRSLTNSNISSTATSDSTTSSGTSTDTTNSTSDLRYSDTPQQQISDIRDGKYVTDYNYNQNSGSSTASSTGLSTSNGTNNSQASGQTNESITKTPESKIAIFNEFLTKSKSIYTMIFRDLDELFYQVI